MIVITGGRNRGKTEALVSMVKQNPNNILLAAISININGMPLEIK